MVNRVVQVETFLAFMSVLEFKSCTSCVLMCVCRPTAVRDFKTDRFDCIFLGAANWATDIFPMSTTPTRTFMALLCPVLDLYIAHTHKHLEWEKKCNKALRGGKELPKEPDMLPFGGKISLNPNTHNILSVMSNFFESPCFKQPYIPSNFKPGVTLEQVRDARMHLETLIIKAKQKLRCVYDAVAKMETPTLMSVHFARVSRVHKSEKLGDDIDEQYDELNELRFDEMDGDDEEEGEGGEEEGGEGGEQVEESDGEMGEEKAKKKKQTQKKTQGKAAEGAGKSPTDAKQAGPKQKVSVAKRRWVCFWAGGHVFFPCVAMSWCSLPADGGTSVVL